MKAPLNWIKDYIDLDDLSIEEIANVMTMVGLEVDGIRLVGLPMPAGEHHEFKYEGLSWPADKFVVAQVEEVLPHPDADRLVLCRLNDGQKELIVLTGAPNLYPYKGVGQLEKPLKVAYAREGAVLYDGHKPGSVLTKLKRMKIRGVESFSMICSEKELGISETHEGVIILDDDAPTGMPLVDYMGDAVLDISILPNMVRDASIVGMAREIAAVIKRPLHKPDDQLEMKGEPIKGRAAIEIRDAELNPRFVLGLVEGVEIKSSPYWVQRRLNLADMRPINCIVDATNYTMLEIGEPLHAFDYDILIKRAGGKAPTIITRTAEAGEKLTTLDGETYELESFMELVTDQAGALSLAGVMGGEESEVNAKTSRVLLEGAAWNFINIRKTISRLKINSEASYRFSRGIHPALADQAVRLCLKRMLAWGGGMVADGLIDEYPAPPEDPAVEISMHDVERMLGTAIPIDEIQDILTRLEFDCELNGDTIKAKTPPLRLDINPGLVGKADILEEISRIYGFDRIPPKRLSEELPPQHGSRALDMEELMRDLLVDLGLQDTVAYRQTSPEREMRILPEDAAGEVPEYLRIKNPITADRTVMRRSILATMLEILEHNCRLRQHLAMFEIGPVFIPNADQLLPDEVLKLSIGMTGLRSQVTWQDKCPEVMGFYDLKGVIEGLMDGLHIHNLSYQPVKHPSFHPGKCAEIMFGEKMLGVFGELHPLVKAHYEFNDYPVLAAELDVASLLEIAAIVFDIEAVPSYPPVIEDIAIIVDETTPAAQIEALIWHAGGKMLNKVRLFDVYRDEKIGVGKKSMAYNLTYIAPDRTLTDKEAAKLRNKIVKKLEKELSAVLRSQ